MWWSYALLIGAIVLSVFLRGKKKKYTLSFLGVEDQKQFLLSLQTPPFELAENILNLLPDSMSRDETEVMKLLLDVLDDKTIPFLKKLMTDEIQQTANETILFRGTTICSRILSTYTARIGRPYLQTILGESIRNLVYHPIDLEVFPSRLEPGADLDTNRHKLEETFQNLFDLIKESTPMIPKPFQELTHHMWVEVNSKFPNLAQSCVGSFFFLRFICPACTIPQEFGIVMESPCQKSQRGLILIAKILQALANDVPFQKKEESMLYFNPLLDKNRNQFFDFLQILAKKPEKLEIFPQSSPKQLEMALGALEKQLPIICKKK